MTTPAAPLQAALVVAPDRVFVPANRWDLLPAGPSPAVSVVVTHYDQPRQLTRVLGALALQTLAPFEVVVTDDGSPSPPAVPDGVRLVRQQDCGFRAAAARNLGAATTSGAVLAFLDADTVPEPDYLEQLVTRLAACPDVLAVGRRRHADLSGDGRELPEPGWLREAYADSRNLLDADGRSFRFVLSAVMACGRDLFDDVGGFDERFVGYGGEDWDFAYRAWNNGAVLVHERAALAWHDGPDWAGRSAPESGDRTQKDAESARLAALIPEPHTRGAPLPQALPDVLVDVLGGDLRTVHCLLRQDHRDLQVRVPYAGEAHVSAVRTDPWTADQLARARVRVRLDRPCLLAPDQLGRIVALLTEAGWGETLLTVSGQLVGAATSTRALGRERRWRDAVVDPVGEAFGRQRLEVEVVPPREDLAGFLAAG